MCAVLFRLRIEMRRTVCLNFGAEIQQSLELATEKIREYAQYLRLENLYSTAQPYAASWSQLMPELLKGFTL